MKLILEIETTDVTVVNQAIVLLATYVSTVEPIERKAKAPTKAKEPKVIPEVKVKKETPPEAPESDVEITLVDLKERAKNKVSTSSRETVKKLISKYAEKLAEVKKADYIALYAELV